MTQATNPARVGLPVRIVAQTVGDTTAIAIAIGEVAFAGAGLVLSPSSHSDRSPPACGAIAASLNTRKNLGARRSLVAMLFAVPRADGLTEQELDSFARASGSSRRAV